MTSQIIVYFLVCSQVLSTIAIPNNYAPLIDPTFDWQLLKTVITNHHKNVILSPVSLKILMALLYEGSAGDTENEIQRVLNFNSNKTEVKQEFSTILKNLQFTWSKFQQSSNVLGCDVKQNGPNEYYTLDLETRIFLDSALQPQQAFQSKACDYYQTQIEPTNFTDADQAAYIINSWVNRVTKGKIAKLADPDDIRDAVLIMANAIYFKGMWVHAFPKNQSHTGGFYVTPNQVVQAQYMSNTDLYYYTDSKELNAKFVRIPYKGDKFSMTLILPNAKAGLSDLIQRIDIQKLRNALNLRDLAMVDVILPKFKFEFQAKLADELKKMGLTTMFEEGASFPGITKGNVVKPIVSDIIQKCGIEVNEEGSIAYAATDVQIANKFGEVQNVFNATNPFLFLIEDEQTHTILFIGKVENPMENENIPTPVRFGDNIIPVQPTTSRVEVPPYNKVEAQNTPAFQLNPSLLNDPDDSLTKRFNYFDLELLREISSDENVFISPASIKATLGMILEGARGVTQEEIAKTLRLPLDPKDYKSQLEPLLYLLSDKTGSSVLESANGIFVNKKLQVVQDYRNMIEQVYRGFIASVDFSHPTLAADKINSWVNNSTRGYIPKIVSPDNLDASSSLIVTNAMYFKGVWRKTFDEKGTVVKPFQLPTRQTRMVYMMQNTDFLPYKLVEDIDAHALEIPYADDKFAMLILLPRVKNNIHALMKDLQHASFGNIVNRLDITEVLFEIPRFEIDFDIDLVRPLRVLGIHELFTDEAKLNGIIVDQQVKVENIIHKTKIQVDERGTVAAAATGAIVIPLMGSSTPRIIADHPFAFFIYRKDNQNILFEGIVNRPTEANTSNQQRIVKPIYRSRG